MKNKIRARPVRDMSKSFESIRIRLEDAQWALSTMNVPDAEDAMKDVRRIALAIQRDFRLARKAIITTKRRKAKNKE